MSKSCLGIFLTLGLAATCAVAQQLDFKSVGAPLKPAPPDPEIRAALNAVSTEDIHRTIEKLTSFKTRNSLSSMEDMPEGTGIAPAAEWIRSQFEAYSKDCGGCLEIKLDVFTQPPSSNPGSRVVKPTRFTNIYAILKGSDPAQAHRMYLVTGHYDSRATDVMNPKIDAPGANDDSSGSAVSLESARVLSKHRFPATLVFVAVAGEEQGLVGSAHLAQLARKEGWDLEGVLNNDIVGGNTSPRDTLQSKTLVRVFSEGVPSTATEAEIKHLLSIGAESDSPSRELAREVLDTSRTYLPSPAGPSALKPIMILRLDRYLRGGDHRSFNQEGFAAVRFTEWREDYKHQHQTVRMENGMQYGDLIQFDDFQYMTKIARMNMAALANMASAPGSPTNVRMSTAALDNNSVLKFQAPDGAPADTWYQIVWRETDASDWQYAGRASTFKQATAGTEHTVTLPISKDNVYFGVRSCNPKGQCSAAVAPVDNEN